MSGRRKYRPEDVLGILLLIGAFALSGLFHFQSDEPLVEAGISAQARAITKDSLHGMSVAQDGRHLTLHGLADSEIERDGIMAALRQIEGRGRLRDRSEILEPVSPFVMEVRKGVDGLRFSGAIPTEHARRVLQRDFGEGLKALTLASGAPDAEWAGVAEAGLRALNQLEDGRMRLEDRALNVTGRALTPEEEGRALLLLEDLPGGYRLTHSIEVLDDGTPLRLNSARSEGAAGQITGKLPVTIAEVLNAEGGAIDASPLPVPFDGWEGAVFIGLEALEPLNSGYLSIIGATLTLSGDAWSQDAYDTTMAALERLPEGMRLAHDITLADSGAPFGLILARGPAGVTARGKVPQSLAAPVLSALTGKEVKAGALEIARVSPGPDFWEGARIGAEALKLIAEGKIVFDGEVLAITADVDDPPAEARLHDHLAALPEGITPALELTLIDDGSPLVLDLRFDGERAVLSGKRPEALSPSELQTALSVPVSEVEMIVTPRTGPVGWTDAVLQNATILGSMVRGHLRVDGDVMRLSGTVRNPEAERLVLAAVNGLPEQARPEVSLTFMDDGRPFAFRLVLRDGQGVLSGKLPTDLGPASQGAILGRPVVAEDMQFSNVSADADWWSAARAALRAMSLLSDGVLSMDAHSIRLVGTAPDPVSATEALARLAPYERAFKVDLEIGN